MWERFIHRMGSIFGKGSSTGDSSFGVVVGVSVVLACVASAVVLLLQFVPILLYMIQGITFPKLLGLLPALMIFTFVFGLMAFILFMGMCVGVLSLFGLAMGWSLKRLLPASASSTALWNSVWGGFKGYLFFLFPLLVMLGVKYFHWPVSSLFWITIFAALAAGLLSLRSIRVVTGKSSWLSIPMLVQILPVAIVLWKFFPKIAPWIT